VAARGQEWRAAKLERKCRSPVFVAGPIGQGVNTATVLVALERQKLGLNPCARLQRPVSTASSWVVPHAGRLVQQQEYWRLIKQLEMQLGRLHHR